MRRGNYANEIRQESHLEAESDQLADEMKDKIKSLKSLSIEIGNELRDQNNFLSNMDDDFDKSGGFLSKAMNRVKKLSKGSHNHVKLYLFLFALAVFIFLWLIISVF